MSKLIKVYKKEATGFGYTPVQISLDQIVSIDNSSFTIREDGKEVQYHSVEITSKTINKRLVHTCAILGIIAIVMIILASIIACTGGGDNYSAVYKIYGIVNGISSATTLAFIGSLFCLIPYGSVNQTVYMSDETLKSISE